MTDYEMIREEGRFDDVGTVRVCDKFGTLAVYVKLDENCWRATYIDPPRNSYLCPLSMVSDAVATTGTVVFSPKSVV
jgi:hypothetical protein